MIQLFYQNLELGASMHAYLTVLYYGRYAKNYHAHLITVGFY